MCHFSWTEALCWHHFPEFLSFFHHSNFPRRILDHYLVNKCCRQPWFGQCTELKSAIRLTKSSAEPPPRYSIMIHNLLPWKRNNLFSEVTDKKKWSSTLAATSEKYWQNAGNVCPSLNAHSLFPVGPFFTFPSQEIKRFPWKNPQLFQLVFLKLWLRSGWRNESMMTFVPSGRSRSTLWCTDCRTDWALWSPAGCPRFHPLPPLDQSS